MNHLKFNLVLSIVSCISVRSQEQPLPENLASLVLAERQFAARCAEKGIRESFLEFLADSSILFRPHPVNGMQFLVSRPAPATPPPVLLAWSPIYAEISEAGDLGYTTGPYELTDLSQRKGPIQYGAFFSIWKEQGDGAWRVVLDAGIQTSSITASLNSPVSLPPHMKRQLPNDLRGNIEAGKMSLIEAEKNFARMCSKKGIVPAYAECLCSCARMHRNMRMPVVGRDSIIAFLENQPATVKSNVIASDVAQSGDLGYAYGRVEACFGGVNAGKGQGGYFVRVWRRNASNKWVIMFDSISSLPEEKK